LTPPLPHCHTGFRLNNAVAGSRAAGVFAAFTLLYCAAAINFSWIQFENNSDTVLPALISIDRYSPFYWSENRFGMLVPLLAMPVREYGWNLLVQSQIIVFAGFGVMVLLARFSNLAAMPVITVGLAGCALLATLKPLAALILLLPGSPYFVSLFLSLAALWALFEVHGYVPARWIFGAMLVALALWVNIGNVVLLAAAIAVYPKTPTASLKPRAAALLLVISCAAGVSAISSMYPGGDFRKLLPVSLWLDTLARLAQNLAVFVRPVSLGLIILAGVACRLLRRGAYQPADGIAAAAVFQILVSGASEWVSKNGYDARYIIAPILIITAVAIYALIGPAALWLQRLLGRSTAVALSCLLGAAIVTRLFGMPSPRAALDHLDRATSDVAGPVRALSCTHVIGSYWSVWETVFNDRLHTRQQRLWGVSHRSDAVRDQWTSIPAANRRFCAVCTDTYVDYERVANGVGRLEKEGEVAGVCAYREIP
jgi:hypothetical protein